ncbi:MAG: cellulase family glycosylhydrolase, partial [Ramlibacter sp.]|uniref:glycoside hydrolase family 5 protein n=1 Tax=Ramlibacter sp. TaxID=1917967 RepID=UPI0026142F81
MKNRHLLCGTGAERWGLAAVAALLALSAASAWALEEPRPPPRHAAGQACHAVSRQACEVAHALGRGVNLGNALDAPREGDWGLRLEPALLDRATRHFQTVRLPVRWSNHASPDAQARLDETFARRVDAAIERLLAGGGFVILDMHHYKQLTGGSRHPNEFAVDPAVVEARLVNLWRQIAARYRDRPPRLLFELLNEPEGEARDTLGQAPGAA